MAHHTAPNGDTYVDSDFVNDSQRVRGVTLQHMGFGEFYADTPKGRVDFDRMRGKKFDGMKGRSHKLYGPGAEWLVSQMEQGGFSERTAQHRRAARPPEVGDEVQLQNGMRGLVEEVYPDKQSAWVWTHSWSYSMPWRDLRVVGKIRDPRRWKREQQDAKQQAIDDAKAQRERDRAEHGPGIRETLRQTEDWPSIHLANATLRLANQFEPDTAEHKALLAALVEAGHDPRAADKTAADTSMRTELIRLASTYPAGSKERKDVLAMIKSAASLSVGDIMYSSWGYDQTNIDFYEVVSATPSTVQIRHIEKKIVQQGRGSDQVMPVAGRYTGPPKRKKIQVYNDGPYVRLNSYSSARLWDGKPKSQTAAGWGH